jgi:3-dehydroquinate dehydratase I
MRICVDSPLRIRNIQLGGEQPLFCIPLVARTEDELLAQANSAHAYRPELVEWRADFLEELSESEVDHLAFALRAALPNEAIIFTLRIKNEGGAQDISQPIRRALIEAALRTKCIDIVDLELANGAEFLCPLIGTANEVCVKVILAFHDFQQTSSSEDLLRKIATMRDQGADIAKIAVMPTCPEDVVRLLQMSITARRRHSNLPLAIMSMGALGSISRVAGFLYGSDMAFAVGEKASAPGQIPISDARALTEMLLRHACLS